MNTGKNNNSGSKDAKSNLVEKIIQVRRVAKVVKGGRRFGFSALVVVGDGNGKLGIASGKALEVSEAVKKASEKAKKHMTRYNLHNRTIHHQITVKFGASRLCMKPAPVGSGIISSGSVRAVMEALGIKDINVKSIGSSNPGNMVHAAIKGLNAMQSFETVAQVRGKSVESVNLLNY